MKKIIQLFLLISLQTNIFSQDVVKPNIILIMFDDLNDYTEQLGGQPQIETPNLTAAGNLGTEFINSYCVAPQCGPSRASMITGKDCKYTQVYNNPDHKCHDFRIMFKPMYGNETVFTIPELLKDSGGYFTYEINKIMHCHENLIDYDDVSPDMCDKSLSWNRVLYYDDSASINGIGDATLGGPDNFRWSLIPDSLEKYIEDYVAVDSAIAFLDDYAVDPSVACNKPFFLGVGFTKPHLPFFIPEHYYSDLYLKDIYSEPFNYPYNNPLNIYPYNGVVMPPQPDIPFDDYYNLPEDGVAASLVDPSTLKSIFNYAEDISPLPEIDPGLSEEQRIEITKQTIYANAVLAYIATIKFADNNLGRLMANLESHPDLYNNTILIITSDHGYSLGEKYHMLKGALWETDIRVPLIIADLRNPMHQVSNQMVSHLDLFPTICDLTGINYPTFPDGSNYLDGKSLTPVIENVSAVIERPVITTYIEKATTDQGGCFPQYSIRDERFHYIRYATNNVMGNLECNADSSFTQEEFYEIGVNREIDPNEWNNLIENPDYKPVIEYLQQWLPDSNLYLQKTYTVQIQNNELPCFAGYSDTIKMYFDFYDENGNTLLPSADFNYKWTNNLTADVFYGASLNFPVASIDEAIFDANSRLMFYLQTYDSTGRLVAFDTKYFYINPDNNPVASFNLINNSGLTASVIDFSISGSYTNYWWDFGGGYQFYNIDDCSYTYPVAGTYTVKLYIQYGNTNCIATIEKTIKVAVHNYLNSNLLVIFPNPSKHYINVFAKQTDIAEPIRIMNVWGQTIITIEKNAYNEAAMRINIEDLKPGIYFLNYMENTSSFVVM